jgi:hypothetical protein
MLAVAAAAPAQRVDDSCTWGASSVMVEVVDGKAAETAPPATSGCIPR